MPQHHENTGMKTTWVTGPERAERLAVQQSSHSTVMALDPSEGHGRRAPGGASRRGDGQRRPRLVNTGAQTTRFILWIPQIL